MQTPKLTSVMIANSAGRRSIGFFYSDGAYNARRASKQETARIARRLRRQGASFHGQSTQNDGLVTELITL